MQAPARRCRLPWFCFSRLPAYRPELQLPSWLSTMHHILEQIINPGSDGVINRPEIHSKKEDSDNHHGSRGPNFLERWRSHLFHLGAHVVVEIPGSFRPGLNRRRQPVLLRCNRHLVPYSSLFLPLTKILAGAEGFEPPSSVLETDSLTVELTPL